MLLNVNEHKLQLLELKEELALPLSHLYAC